MAQREHAANLAGVVRRVIKDKITFLDEGGARGGAGAGESDGSVTDLGDRSGARQGDASRYGAAPQ